MELHTGFMSTEELATWFGVTLKSFRNRSASYYEKLEFFCEFERIYGGVMISKIILSKYCKNYKQDDILFNKEIKRCIKEQDGMASISGFSNMVESMPEYSHLSNRQIQYRMSKAALRNYGKYGDPEGGITGNREREWAIKLDDKNHYRALTEEEVKLFNDLVSKCYASAPEKIKQKKKLETQLRNNDISTEEYFNLIDAYNLDLFVDILTEFEIRTGFRIVLATKYEIRAW